MASSSRCSWAVLGLMVPAMLSAGGCRRQRFPSRGDAAAVVVVAPRRDASLPKVGEQEPNDTPASAQPLALAAAGPVIVEAELSAAAGTVKDVDVFRVVIPGERQEAPQDAGAADGGNAEYDPRLHARRLLLEVTPGGGPGVSLQLLDEAGKTLEGIAAEAGTTSGMPNLAVMPGVAYFIRVKPPGKGARNSQAACPYRLTVQLGDFDVADEREPNDSREIATPASVVGTVELSGYLGWAHDQDYYRMALPEIASALDVELDALENVAASLQVLDAAGKRLGSARGPKNERVALRNVMLQPPVPDALPTSRQAYVVVRAETGQNRDRRYVLRLTLGVPRIDAEVEPNDLPEQATPVRDGLFSGYLSAGDIDFFRYDGGGPRSVTFAVSFPRRVRGKLEVFGPDMASAGKAESKRPHQLVSLTSLQAAGQPILLRISGVRGDGNTNEPYTLRVSSTPIP